MRRQESVNPSFMPLLGRIRSTEKNERYEQECFCLSSAFEGWNNTKHNLLENENAGEWRRGEKLLGNTKRRTNNWERIWQLWSAFHLLGNWFWPSLRRRTENSISTERHFTTTPWKLSKVLFITVSIKTRIHNNSTSRLLLRENSLFSWGSKQNNQTQSELLNELLMLFQRKRIFLTRSFSHETILNESLLRGGNGVMGLLIGASGFLESLKVYLWNNKTYGLLSKTLFAWGFSHAHHELLSLSFIFFNSCVTLKDT